MRRFVVAITAATALVAGGAMIGGSAGAAPMGAPEAVRAAADTLNMIEDVQYVWLGHNYCWYDDGWNGPGWYWCGYGPRVGLGWGGGFGWHSWRGGHAFVGHFGGGHFGGGGGHFGGGHFGGGGGGGGGHHHSDIRLKEDIVQLGRLDNGIGVYRFRYKGSDHTAYVGVMAQEVQGIVPNAVGRGRDGYLWVDYDRLGLDFMTWDEWQARKGTDSLLAH